MNRRRFLALTGSLVLVVMGLSGTPAALRAEDDATITDWIERLDSMATRLREARAEEKRLRGEIRIMKRDNYPRGEARTALIEAHEAARRERTLLERDWPDLLEQARRAGVSAGRLQAYDDV